MSYSAVAQRAESPKPQKKRKSKSKPAKKTQQDGEEAVLEESDESSLSPDESTKNEAYVNRLQSRFEEMQKKFNDTFGEVQGISIEKATELIEESNKRIKKETEEYLDKRLKAMTLEMHASNDLLYNKFVHLFDQQTTIIQNMQGNFENEIRTIYDIIQGNPNLKSRAAGRSESLAGDGKT